MALKPITVANVHALRDSIEDDLLESVSKAMRGWLLRVRAAALRAIDSPGGVSLLAAAGDEMPPMGIVAGWWAESVDATVMADVDAALIKAFTRWTDQAIEASPAMEATNAYLANVRDRLVQGVHFGVPVYEDSFNRIRLALAESAALGTTRPQLAQRIAAELSWETDGPYWRSEKAHADSRIDAILDPLGRPGTPARELARLTDPQVQAWRNLRNTAIKHLDAERSVWQTRANLIARTEATGGANFGAYRALLAEGVKTKIWEATGDTRTRPNHVFASGQEVPIDQPFIVGGSLMQFPGDPAGNVSEVANCRCAMVGGDYFKAGPSGALEQSIVTQEDQAAAEQAALEQKWKGKPQPKAPKGLPEKPEAGTPTGAASASWVAKVNARYKAFSGKENIVQSLDTKVTQSMLDATAASSTSTHNAAIQGIDYLHTGKYIDDALRAEILQIWADASTISPEALAAYKKELGLAKRRLRGHKYALRDWRLANGLPEGGAGLGMDGARSFDDDFESIQWAHANLPTFQAGARGANAVTDYTGSYYDVINGALHRAARESSYQIEAATQQRITSIDRLMKPLDQDLYVHRGTTWQEFTWSGNRRGGYHDYPADPSELIGTVQHQPGYMSTSIGTHSRGPGEGKPVQILFRTSKGTKGLNVMNVSNYGDAEQEILLARDIRYFIHSVRQINGRWRIEAEISDAVGMVPTPLTTKVNSHGPSGS